MSFEQLWILYIDGKAEGVNLRLFLINEDIFGILIYIIYVERYVLCRKDLFSIMKFLKKFERDSVDRQKSDMMENYENMEFGPDFIRADKANTEDNIKVVFSWVLKFMLCAFVLMAFSLNFINAEIPSGSMETTIMTGDRIMGYKGAYNSKKSPKRYDIIIFKDPTGSGKYLIKRVIGLPGETLIFKDGDVYLKGSDEPLDDSFCEKQHATKKGLLSSNTVYIPDGCYFVMGDNREDSLDSRYWLNESGQSIPYVNESDIVAKAVFRYYPFSKFGGIK